MIKDSILVTAIGSMSSSVVIERLRGEYRVIGTSIYDRNWIAESIMVDAFYKIAPAKNELNFISDITEVVKREKIHYIIPLTDVEIDVLNRNRERIESQKCVICMSGRNTIDICRDKERLEKFLRRETNVKCIPILSAEEAINNNVFPCIYKPKHGRSSEGVIIVRDEEYLNIISKRITNGYILQPFIEGSVICVDVIRQEKHSIMMVSRKELLRTKNGAGISVHVFIDEELNQVCKKLAEVLDVKGCVNFEFILTESGKYFFMECNPRFSGGIGFSVLSSSYDFVSNHVNCFRQGCDIDSPTEIKEMYMAKKYIEYQL